MIFIESVGRIPPHGVSSFMIGICYYMPFIATLLRVYETIVGDCVTQTLIPLFLSLPLYILYIDVVLLHVLKPDAHCESLLTFLLAAFNFFKLPGEGNSAFSG